MDLKQLNYFLVVVEHRSFRKAAEALNVSQPALSISVKRLEDSLGCLLLDRTPGGVIPTAFGISLCQSIRRIQQEVRLAQDRLLEIHGIAKGQVAIGVSPYAFTNAFATLLADYVRDFPGVNLSTRVETTESALPLLNNHQLDFFIAEVANSPQGAHVGVSVLYRNPYVVLARPEHPLAKRRKLQPVDLVEYKWIYGTDMVRNVKNWSDTFVEAGLTPPNPVVAGGEMKFHVELLRSSDFLAALPLTHIQEGIAAGEVVKLQIAEIEWFNFMDIVYRNDISMSPAAQRLFDAVLAQMRQDGNGQRSLANKPGA